MSWNKLLEKQIRNHFPIDWLEREEIKKFLQAVDNSYNSYERDRALSAHAFSISEKEYALVNQQLQQEISLKKLGIINLSEAIKSIEGPDSPVIPLHEEEDNLLFALSYLKESMSRQKKMEMELKDSEMRISAAAKTFSQLIRNLNNGILVEDAERKIVLVNQLFCDIFSIPLAPDMLVGMDCHDASNISKALFKDGDDFVARVGEIMAKKELVTGEELEMTDGRLMVRDYIPIYVENEYKGNLWKYKNITQERETQSALQRLSLVASSNENGVLFTDNNGTITWANEGFSRLTGYSNEEITGNTPIGLCKGPLTEKESLRTMLELFQAGKNFSVELIHYRKDGTWFWGKVKGQSIQDEQGNDVRYFAMIEDFTKEKQLGLELIEAKEHAEQSSRAKEIFLANMSHEIRTPMNAILGMSRQLKKTDLDKQQRFYLDTVHSAADHLMVVINDILDISKIEAGRLVVETIGFSMDEAARRVQRVMFHKAEEKGLELSFSLDKAIHPVLLGDPYRLNQVLLNLVSNAIKFTAKGSVSIAYNLVSGYVGKPAGYGMTAGQMIRIVVTDTGIGMEEEFLEHIFQKFVQEDEAVARRYGGTGLGMSICKQLVELMGGVINLSSRKGEGTKVSIDIPFAMGDASDKKEEEKIITDAAILKNKHILLVEDNEMNRLVATTVLHNYGALVDEAVNGVEALNAIRSSRYDLILMDVQMPVMDGLEATRLIRSDIKTDVPVIALTANAIKGESDKCFAAGMNDYISKPFEEEALVGLIGHWLSVSRPLYDLCKLREVSRGNEEFVSKMIKLFLVQVPAAVSEIDSAYTSGDFALIKAVAHRIRPVLDNLGIDSLKPDMKEMESLALRGRPSPRLYELVQKLKETIGKVSSALEPELFP